MPDHFDDLTFLTASGWLPLNFGLSDADPRLALTVHEAADRLEPGRRPRRKTAYWRARRREAVSLLDTRIGGRR